MPKIEGFKMVNGKVEDPEHANAVMESVGFSPLEKRVKKEMPSFSSMTKSELQEYAESQGIELSMSMLKREMIAELEENV